MPDIVIILSILGVVAVLTARVSCIATAAAVRAAILQEDAGKARFTSLGVMFPLNAIPAIAVYHAVLKRQMS